MSQNSRKTSGRQLSANKTKITITKSHIDVKSKKVSQLTPPITNWFYDAILWISIMILELLYIWARSKPIRKKVEQSITVSHIDINKEPKPLYKSHKRLDWRVKEKTYVQVQESKIAMTKRSADDFDAKFAGFRRIHNHLLYHERRPSCSRHRRCKWFIN